MFNDTAARPQAQVVRTSIVSVAPQNSDKFVMASKVLIHKHSFKRKRATDLKGYAKH